MKKFKIADFWISAVLVPACVLFGIIAMNDKSIYAYFIVGGWQVISMTTHWVNKWFANADWRRSYYHKFVLTLAAILVLVAVLAGFEENFFIILIAVLFILLIVSPLMAVYYTFLCYEETFIRMKRPMELLK